MLQDIKQMRFKCETSKGKDYTDLEPKGEICRQIKFENPGKEVVTKKTYPSLRTYASRQNLHLGQGAAIVLSTHVPDARPYLHIILFYPHPLVPVRRSRELRDRWS